jgi:GNAT superfamily N-acetyltransferase
MEFKINKTKALSENQFAQINKLWNEEYPAKLKDRFPILLEGVSKYNHYLIEDIYKNIIAWAVDFEKEGEIRFSIIVNKSYRGRRLGTRLMERLILEHKQLYGWVIDHNNDLKLDGTYYQSPMNFYLKLGLVAMHDCRIDNDMIKAVKVKWISKNK